MTASGAPAARRKGSWPGTVLRVAKPLLTVSALALAVWLVRHEMGRLRLADVLAALRATPAWAILASAGLSAASYGCLVGAEWCAFRYLGQPQPWRRMALRSFASHALASNLGFGLASGAAVRLRIYRPFHLPAKVLAALSVRISLMIFLSGAITLGLVLPLARAPTLSTSLPGLLLISLAAFWFVDFGKGPGAGPDRLSPSQRLLALGFSIGDWIFSGAALFALSAHGVEGLAAFLAVFVSGSLAGSLVGLPAALGVLDAAVLGSSVLSAGVHETAAALLLYRVIYFLVPLVLTLGVSGVRVAMRLGEARRS